MKTKVETLIDQIDPDKIYCPIFSEHIAKKKCSEMIFLKCHRCENIKVDNFLYVIKKFNL